jgi:Fe-S cluster assembly scaffold protein SufB
MPKWGGAIDIDFQDIFYYLKPTDHQGKTWDDVPQEIKDTFDKLGIPEAEKKFLGRREGSVRKRSGLRIAQEKTWPSRV